VSGVRSERYVSGVRSERYVSGVRFDPQKDNGHRASCECPDCVPF
jgi:hypothetical protein